MMEMGAKAAAIMEAMIEQRQTEDVADAFMEAYGRGPAWKEAIRKSLSEIDDGQRQPIQSALAHAIESWAATRRNSTSKMQPLEGADRTPVESVRSAGIPQPVAVEDVEDGAELGRRNLVDAAVAAADQEPCDLPVDLLRLLYCHAE